VALEKGIPTLIEFFGEAMAGRLAAKVAQDEDFENFILMHAMGANTAGQLGSVMAGGVLLALVTGLV